MFDDREVFLRDTHEHINAVRYGMQLMIRDLVERSLRHDASKIVDPEAAGFIAMMADVRLKDMDYGSDDYKRVLAEHQPTLQHHYAENDHHPEHFPDGICGMTLGAMQEMLADWNASTKRMKGGGDLRQSIEINQGRFGYSGDVKAILLNTARDLGMLS